MSTQSVAVVVGKDIVPAELAVLMSAVGWGDEAPLSVEQTEKMQRALAAYPFVAHARDHSGTLVGYVSAFCDGVFTTFIGELVVHPSLQRQGIGRRLMGAVETYADGVPIYATPFEDQQEFFVRLGYRRAKRPMTVLFKR